MLRHDLATGIWLVIVFEAIIAGSHTIELSSREDLEGVAVAAQRMQQRPVLNKKTKNLPLPLQTR
jgi:hypothetical protein